MKKRLREYDFIRAVAALSVIVIHISGVYAGASRTGYFCNQFVRYAVPVFLILSGLLLYNSDKDKTNINYREFLQKRFKKILIPYLVWYLVYMIYNNRHNLSNITKVGMGDLYGALKGLLLGSGATHLYFIIIIIQMYLIYPFLRKLIIKYPKIVLSVSFVFTLFLQTLVYLNQMNLIKLHQFPVPYFMMFPTWLFYFSFGIFAVKFFESYKERILEAKAIFVILWFFSLAVLLIDGKFTRTFESSVRPSVILYSVASFFLFYIVSYGFRESTNYVTRFLEWISAQSFVIYFSHILLIRIIRSVSTIFGFTNVWNGSIGMVILFLSAITVTFAFVFILSLTPFSSILGGVRSNGIGKRLKRV